jgi:hypothetical protein
VDERRGHLAAALTASFTTPPAAFESRPPRCVAVVYVDDATSRLMQLHFAATEGRDVA